MPEQYDYFAFISHNSKDVKWGKRLQRKLEHYKMPATLCSERGWKRTPIKPIFFAPTDIQPGGLSEELQQRLLSSRNLIVISSPNSAQSEWVGKEIAFFHQLGRSKDIHFFIVDGIPHSGNKDTECLHPIIEELGLPEILGANIHEKVYSWSWLNKERAYVQLVSKLLNVEFDSVWKRHRRQLIRKVIQWIIGIIAVLTSLFCVWKLNQPVDVQISLKEQSDYNAYLPKLKDATVKMILDNETKTGTIQSLDSYITFTNIPHKYLNQPIHITVACNDYLPIDTTVTLTKATTLYISRDPSIYGNVHFRIWNPFLERAMTNTKVSVDEYDTSSDSEGVISLSIPLKNQKKFYLVKGPFTLESDTLMMPCETDDVLLIKSAE